MQKIKFFADDVNYQLRNKKAIRNWLKEIAKQENQTIQSLSIIICSDSKLLEINKEFLNHDYYTDTITFDYTENKGLIGEIYLSIDRIRENAKTLKVSIIKETHRVLSHSLLHLCGYFDKTPEQKSVMRSKEDKYLSLRPKFNLS